MKKLNLFWGLAAVFVLIFSSLALAAESSIDLTSVWTANQQTSLTVNQGERAELWVEVTSATDFNLWVELFQQGNLVRKVIAGMEVAANPETSYSQPFIIDTKELKGDYKVWVDVINKGGDEASAYLDLNVKVPPLDTDKDGFPDGQDNCPTKANPDQKDTDQDGKGDVCDSYPDCQSNKVDVCGVCDGPGESTWYKDEDNDGLGDSKTLVKACQKPAGYVNNEDDKCPKEAGAKENQGCPLICSDGDKDGVCDEKDNCPLVSNPEQADIDEDGKGNACEHSPIIQPIEDLTVQEGEEKTVKIFVSDEDKDKITVLVDNNVVLKANFFALIDKGNNVWDFTFKISQDFVRHPKDKDSFEVKVIASDNDPSTPEAEETFQITVIDVNRQPVLISFSAPQESLAGQAVSFSAAATDADGDELAYTWTFGDGFNSNQQNPVHTYTSAGEYTVTLAIADGFGGKITETREIKVKELIKGCTDKKAQNYNPQANVDDGSCRYAPEEIPGCMDEKALNYNPKATFDDGSCRYPPEIAGCTDPRALNYNPRATFNDGTCQYPPGNQAPRIISSPSFFAQEGQEYTYQLIVFEPNNDALVYKLTQGPEGVSFDGKGLLTWTPENPGRFCLTLKVTEVTPEALADSQHFCLEVRTASQALKFNQVEVLSEFVSPGDYLLLFVELSNEGAEDLDNLKITTTLPELGLRRSLGPFDLEKGETLRQTIYLEIPDDAEAGEYSLRLVASDNEVAHIVHRLIEVIQ